MLVDHGDGLFSSSFIAWSSIAQSVCQWAFSLLEIQFRRPWFESCIQQRKKNLSPFDSKIACLCQSNIEINNNKQIESIKNTHSGIKRKDTSMVFLYFIYVYEPLFVWGSPLSNMPEKNTELRRIIFHLFVFYVLFLFLLLTWQLKSNI